jgi:hypothetical protein
MSEFFANPAEIRNLYEQFIDNVKKDEINKFLRKNAKKAVQISDEQIKRIIMLLEAQKFMLFSFTSCAWFFNDISGIEPAQNLRYALRAWQLTYPDVKTNSILREFVLILQQAKSNYPKLDGKKIIEKEAFPMINHLERVAFTMTVNHYLYGIYSGSKKFALDDYSYSTDIVKSEVDLNYDKKNWRIYSAEISHKISRESNSFVLALYKNVHQIEGVVISGMQKVPKTDVAFAKLMKDANLLHFTLCDTIMSFRDHITKRFVNDFANDTYLDYLSWAGTQSNRLDAITDINGGLPSELAGTVQFYINKEWNTVIAAFLSDEKETDKFVTNLSEINIRANRYAVSINKIKSAEKIRQAINEDLLELNKEFFNEKLAQRIITKLEVVQNLSIPLNFHQVQDRFYLIYKQIINDVYPQWVANGKPLGKERSTIILINKLAKRFRFNTHNTSV